MIFTPLTLLKETFTKVRVKSKCKLLAAYTNKLLANTQLFINNQFVPGNGPSIDLLNPATEEVICSVHSADESDVNRAVKVAQDAYNNVWRRTAPAERTRLLNKLADLLDRDQEEIAYLATLENG